MTTDKTTIYLADLTHTGQTVASNMFPLSIGLLGAQLTQDLGDTLDVNLFKYPADLSSALESKQPAIIGFSNYSWNCNLAYDYACRIKTQYPETVIVFGGPNYGLREEEIAEFWKRYPLIDFYIVKEGELAFVQLVQVLITYGFDIDSLKSDGIVPDNCHYAYEGIVRQGNILPRVTSLEDLPSPYLMGIMDKFFDDVLVPLIHTTRGCPFTCTFCTEGAGYYNKVAQRTNIKDELEYIAKRIGNVQDVFITDANFGMFNQDRQKAEVIASIKNAYGWPQKIYTSTGKNRKERIVEVANILEGSMSIGASLQSTDEAVLENISRTNISMTALNDMAASGNSQDSATFTELIVGLPGDTLEKHTRSLRDVVTAGLGVVRVYQLIMLLQTDLSTPDSRYKYDLSTKHRIMQRSLGRYSVFGEEFVSVESEEICIATSTLEFEEYIACRELALTIELVHNDGAFGEIQSVCQWVGIPWFDFILEFHKNRRNYVPTVTNLYDAFVGDVINGLWDSRERLELEVKLNSDNYLSGERGINEISNAKAELFLSAHPQVREILHDQLACKLRASGQMDAVLEVYLEDLRKVGHAKMSDFFDTGTKITEYLSFDFETISTNHFKGDPKDYYKKQPQEFVFERSETQIDLLNSLINQYGVSLDAKGKILIRSDASKLFRNPRRTGVSSIT